MTSSYSLININQRNIYIVPTSVRHKCHSSREDADKTFIYSAASDINMTKSPPTGAARR